ncbi:hypothetical protein QZN08_27295 [Burkholderia multivorans]|uniref:hypothetical protein n=1 Tax=Burkholderia multivorans TaxID=87883 RepID=UPI001C21FD0D|nr:hypothetical protein [Burkholderia multivorans]MBU9434108.1 hypothetical protein [Burkholderia multivorans]MDN8018141.1 hypothetical protein [Burkholderia multivorans]HDR9188641.1 hypothetical protein [Burkholderia vietnamiensis]
MKKKDEHLRVLKLAHYPKHADQLMKISTHFKVSHSVALQIVIAHTYDIYSKRKELKRFNETKHGKASTHVWTRYNKEEAQKIKSYLEEQEINYTEFSKRAISEFFSKLKNKTIDKNSKSLNFYLHQES